MTHVLDASSLLAFLHDEPGSDTVARALDSAQVGVGGELGRGAAESLWRQVDIKGMLDEFIDLGVRIEPFTPAQAEIAARLWECTKRQGLSLNPQYPRGLVYCLLGGFDAKRGTVFFLLRDLRASV